MHLYHLNSKKGLTCFNGVYLTKKKLKPLLSLKQSGRKSKLFIQPGLLKPHGSGTWGKIKSILLILSIDVPFFPLLEDMNETQVLLH